MSPARAILGEAMRFGLVGLAATATHLGVAFAARGAGAGVFPANLIGFLTALAVSIAGHHYYSFQQRAPLRRSAIRFVPIAVAAFILNNGILSALLSALGPRFADLSLAVAVLAVPLLSFVLARHFAYRPGI